MRIVPSDLCAASNQRSESHENQIPQTLRFLPPARAVIAPRSPSVQPAVKELLHYAGNTRLDAAYWVLACLLMIPLRRSGSFSQPTIQVILYGCLAIYGFRMLVPFAFGSRRHLAENAEMIGTSNPWVARIFCINAMVAVFAGFIAVMLLNDEVSLRVRLGVVLSVVAAGIFSLRRTRLHAHKDDPSVSDAL